MKYTFFFAVLIFLVSSCEKDPKDSGSNSSFTPEKAVFSATVDGMPLTWNSGEALMNQEDNNVVFDLDNELMTIYYQTAFQMKDTLNFPVGDFIISCGSYTHPIHQYTAEDFHNTLSSLPEVFFSENNKGWQLHYFDLAGDLWTTVSGDQAGSSINIMRNEIVPGLNNGDKRLVEGTISCKIYNLNDPGQFKLLEDVNFKLYLYKYDI